MTGSVENENPMTTDYFLVGEAFPMVCMIYGPRFQPGLQMELSVRTLQGPAYSPSARENFFF